MEALPPAGMTPTASPSSSPLSSPLQSPSFPVLAGRGGQKDWRRSFVEKATKASRKVNYLHGSHCRETREVKAVVDDAVAALDRGVKPNLVEDGLGGTYFIKDLEGRTIAVFKPRDEEPLAPNNPKMHAAKGQTSGLKEGVLVGEAAINEYAAFLLDCTSDTALRAGVCPTALVSFSHSVFHSAEEDRNSVFRVIKEKVGSFQLFAKHDCTAEDMGPSRFPAELVHRIAALDIRLCNTDRHPGNILVRQNGGEVSAMVPIDHGYALPGRVGEAAFEWLSWPAAKKPFSQAMRREILTIDSDAVETVLKKRISVIRPECLVTLRICTALLQRGVEAGLTAFDIGTLMTRPESEEAAAGLTHTRPSVLEELVANARKPSEAKEEGELCAQRLDRLIRAKCREVARETAPTPSVSSGSSQDAAPTPSVSPLESPPSPLRLPNLPGAAEEEELFWTPQSPWASSSNHKDSRISAPSSLPPWAAGRGQKDWRRRKYTEDMFEASFEKYSFDLQCGP